MTPEPEYIDFEHAERVARLMGRGMTSKAARTVIDAAMYGIGCVEGTVRAEIQKRLDKEAEGV